MELFECSDVEVVKKEKSKPKQVFKTYEAVQRELFLENLDDLLPRTHFARFLYQVVMRIDHSGLEQKYKGGGTSAYNPKMMLMAWLLGYYYHIFTSRPLAKLLRENIAFMWISGKQMPDFRTLNNFRQLLGEDIKEYFKKTLECAIGLGLIDGTQGFIDGTIIEANANKHKVVWKKQVKKALEKTRSEISELADFIETHAKKEQKNEDRKYGDEDLSSELSREARIDEVLKIADEIEETLKGKRKTDEEKELFEKSKRLKLLDEREKNYEEKEATLGEKNSYSKTDPDAPVKMDKEGILRPGYTDVTITQNQIALDYETDIIGERRLLRKSVEEAQKNTGIKLKDLVGDGGFGDEENYSFLEEEKIEAYLKHNRFYKEKSKKWHGEQIRASAFRRQLDPDILVCPNGKKLKLEKEIYRTFKNGYTKKQKEYRAEESDCKSCPFKEFCTKSKARTVMISEKYEKQREKANKLARSKKGRKLFKQRGMQVETVFGERKRNFRNRRYMLRGLKKVRIESGLFYTTYNLKKVYNHLINNFMQVAEYLMRKRGIRAILELNDGQEMGFSKIIQEIR